jgi:hypothetical protein
MTCIHSAQSWNHRPNLLNAVINFRVP